jgi:hypothetical protein
VKLWLVVHAAVPVVREARLVVYAADPGVRGAGAVVHLWYVKPGLVVHAADPVVGIGLHELAVLAPVLPEEDIHQDTVHCAGDLLRLEQLCHPLGDELNRVDGTAP